MTSDTPSQAARAGWKLVPVTATDEMLGTLLKRFDSPQSWWQALLAVSPAPPAEALPAGVDAKALRGIIARWDSRREVLNTNPSVYDAFITQEIAALTSAPAPEDRSDAVRELEALSREWPIARPVRAFIEKLIAAPAREDRP